MWLQSIYSPGKTAWKTRFFENVRHLPFAVELPFGSPSLFILLRQTGEGWKKI